jgi:hypothetical protein
MVRYPVSDMNALELEDGEVGTVWFRKETRLHTSQNYRANGVSRPRTHVSTTQVGFKRITAPRSVYSMILRLVDPPVIVTEQGEFLGRLSVSPVIRDGVCTLNGGNICAALTAMCVGR